MTKKQQTLDAIDRNPGWTARQVAESLGCSDAYVRATARRNGRELKKVRSHPNSGGARPRVDVPVAAARSSGGEANACPECGHTITTVCDSRSAPFLGRPSKRRRRFCKNCNHRFTTYEFTANDDQEFVGEIRRAALTGVLRNLATEMPAEDVYAAFLQAFGAKQ